MLDRLVIQIPLLQYGAVKVLLGSFEHVNQKARCPSCRSISTAVIAKRPNIPLNWLLAFHTGRFMWSFELIYSDNIFIADRESKRGSLTAFLPLKSIFPDRKYGRSFAADHIDLSLVKTWIQKCNSHSECCTTICHVGLSKPSSLLFIDVHEQCLVSRPTNVPYLALSYVWGGVANFMTTKGNIKNLRCPRAFSVPSIWNVIPQTIKDAIYLTRCLNVGYLWVDSLCIVQDDDDSMQSLLRAMPAIYANAHFTIVAADGVNANHGLRGVSSQRRNVCRIRINLPNTTLMEYVHRSADGAGSPWAYRGWTFQEALFSRRMLIFDGLISWVCNLTQYYEEIELPPTWPDYEQGRALRSLYVQGIPSQKHKAFTWNDVPNLHGWRELVTSYQRRDLTYESDVLNAFVGVQEVLGPGFRRGFFYGLPEMFFDMALLWQPRSSASPQGGKMRNERNPHFPSWSWAGWKGEFDDRIWQKCFNYVYIPLGEVMLDDCIQIVPLVKWHKRSTADHLLEAVDNSYHVFQTQNGASDPILPQGWSFDAKDQFYIWKGQNDPEKRFRYPLPIEERINGDSKSRYDPYLYLTTQRAWLRLAPDPESPACLCANLQDRSGNWLGIVRLNSDTWFSTPESWQTYHEFIAISLGKAKILSDVEISGPTIPPASNFRNTYGGRILEEWTYIQKTHVNPALYEFYNVLCIERNNGIAYRKALGRVVKAAWERQDLEEIDVVLG
jgi:hypothetical protein